MSKRAGESGSDSAVLTHDGDVPEFIHPEQPEDVEMFDMVDEGVFIVRWDAPIAGGPGEFTAVPIELVAEWLPDIERCLLREAYDGSGQRIVPFADFPTVIARGVRPPIRCDLNVEPCDRCPRRTT